MAHKRAVDEEPYNNKGRMDRPKYEKGSVDRPQTADKPLAIAGGFDLLGYVEETF